MLQLLCLRVFNEVASMPDVYKQYQGSAQLALYASTQL